MSSWRTQLLKSCQSAVLFISFLSFFISFLVHWKIPQFICVYTAASLSFILISNKWICLKFSSLCEIKVEENVHSTGSKEEHSLIMTRVYLALLRPRNSVISLCLSGNNEKIGKCANLLRTTAEKHFWSVCEFRCNWVAFLELIFLTVFYLFKNAPFKLCQFSLF